MKLKQRLEFNKYVMKRILITLIAMSCLIPAQARMYPTQMTVPSICWTSLAEMIENHASMGQHPILRAKTADGGAMFLVSPDTKAWSFIVFRMKDGQMTACSMLSGDDYEIVDWGNKLEM